MPSKPKGSVVLAMLLFLGSAPSWAAVEGRAARSDSSPISAFSAVVTNAISGWLGSIWRAGGHTATAIWANYGIAIDPDGAPAQPSHSSASNGANQAVN
ncbi:MAG TPA: hypothetical protein VGS22_19055 [Thermoanaerobaculia bacterium]|jgi:hypothetical protein|nr:hypothetical protein [Thermoanaerobaculia bacterium]